jgi:hypothetical protein
MKIENKLLPAFLAFMVTISGYSQMTVTSGTTLKILPGSSLYSSENLVLNSGATLDVQGALILNKNLVNQNAAPNAVGSGTVLFSGVASQTVSGQNIIQNLTVNNGAGLILGGSTQVNGALTLTNGLVTLGANNLFLGPSASVAGAPSATRMVVATGAGQIRKEFPSAQTFTFPVGDATGAAEYSPVTIAFSSGTFSAGNYVGLSLANAQFPGTATSYLSRYWTMYQSGISGFSCDAAFRYVDADVVGTESDIFCFQVSPAPFTAFNAANTGTNQIDAHGLSYFGTFTGNLGNDPVPPPIRSLQDKTIAGGPECADATQTLLIAGNGTFYHVTSTGNVTHIAGVNIKYLPGTMVDAGGYMLGKISGTFCTPYVHPANQAPVVAGIENPGTGSRGDSFFRIYPNPTSGDFTVELKGEVTSARVRVEIYGVLGERILSKEMEMEHNHQFSLSERPAGVYVVHVSSGEISGTEKIIKR